MVYSDKTYKIGSVIVLYNPDDKLVGECLDSIIPQVDEVCVVDNSTSSHVLPLTGYGSKVYYKALGKNIGIAAAQNIGIRYLAEKGCDFIVFSDQDSSSPHDLVEKLVRAYMILSRDTDIACVGPMPINRKTGCPYIYKNCIISENTVSGIPYYCMHSILSSYSLVPLSNFSVVGNMDEGLFIDFVDDDWCWRAKAFHGKSSVMLQDVTIHHELGVSSRFMGRQISVSSPFRIYYQTRNLLWMCRKSYVPTYWKRMNLVKLMIKLVYYSAFSDNRLKYIGRMFHGFYDGLFKYRKK